VKNFETASQHLMTQTYQWGTMPEMFGPRHEHRIGMILDQTRRIDKGSLVLEAAVGLGQLGARLRGQGHRVIGVDASFEAALHALRQAGIPTVLGSLNALPFRSEVFGAVTSGETLEHLEDDEGAVREMARVVAPGGTVVSTVPALEWLRTFSDDYYEHKRRYSRAGFASLFRKSSLVVKSCRFWGFPVVLLYDTLFILPMNHRRARQGVGEDPALQSVARVGRMTWLVRLVRTAFATDRLFTFLPIGVGLLLVARKNR
jgi:SAM-dependent methyltransferase